MSWNVHLLPCTPWLAIWLVFWKFVFFVLFFLILVSFPSTIRLWSLLTGGVGEDPYFNPCSSACGTAWVVVCLWYSTEWTCTSCIQFIIQVLEFHLQQTCSWLAIFPFEILRLLKQLKMWLVTNMIQFLFFFFQYSEWNPLPFVCSFRWYSSDHLELHYSLFLFWSWYFKSMLETFCLQYDYVGGSELWLGRHQASHEVTSRLTWKSWFCVWLRLLNFSAVLSWAIHLAADLHTQASLHSWTCFLKKASPLLLGSCDGWRIKIAI